MMVTTVTNSTSVSKFQTTVLSFVFFVFMGSVLVWYYGNEGHVQYATEQWTSLFNQTWVFGSENDSSNETRTKVILFWVPFFDVPDYYFGFGKKPFLQCKCPINNCETTNDRKRINESDVIIFHMRDISYEDLPKTRLPHHRWAFFLMESPVNTGTGLAPYNGLFNWTVTYRNDSDVLLPYFNIRKRDKLQNVTETTTLSNTKPPPSKRKLVSWLVSHCNTDSKRETYVQELRKYIPVDTFGKCGSSCPTGDRLQCHKLVFTQYKFYLSFENSICTDYVTEKFSNALQRHIVPIVYGGADYEKLAPPKSYIDVRDFESPKHLAQYLVELDRNDTLYNEYFAWKSEYEVLDNGIQYSFCDLCAKLHQNDPPKFYKNINDWWRVQGNCFHNVIGF